jgi:hypothetical protein
MKITIKILRIVTIILLIIIVFFVITAVYSVTQISLNVEEIEMFPSSEGMNFSLPFSISNNGYYELADLNLTTRIKNPNGTLLVLSKTFIPSIPKGITINSAHNVTLDLETIMSIDHVPLLLNDSVFDVELFAALNFARAIPIQVSTNTTIPWGAPLSQFSVGRPSISTYNNTHDEATIPASFVNHAVFDLTGILKLHFLSFSGEIIASGEIAINVPSGASYIGEIKAYPRQQDVSELTGETNVRVIFETPMFVVEWEESYG